MTRMVSADYHETDFFAREKCLPSFVSQIAGVEENKHSFTMFLFIDQMVVNSMSSRRVIFMFPQPKDTRIILQQVHVESDSSCRRSVLEVCALKLSDSARVDLVSSEKDDLYRTLRKPKRYQTRYDCQHDIPRQEYLLKQRWHAETKVGQLHTVEALYQLIRANPPAFCRMVDTKESTNDRATKKEHRRWRFIKTLSNKRRRRGKN